MFLSLFKTGNVLVLKVIAQPGSQGSCLLDIKKARSPGNEAVIMDKIGKTSFVLRYSLHS